MSKKFTWDSWNFDCDGDAYIIAKSECPDPTKVPDFIVKNDYLKPECKSGMKVEEGWCKYQVRADWDSEYGDPHGSYYVSQCKASATQANGHRKRGWFPVWIVRKGDWY